MKQRYPILILIVALIFVAGCGIVENDTRNSGEVKKDYITVVKICFDVTDEGLRQITLESEEPAENRKIKEFVSDFMTAVSGLHKRLEG